MTPEQFDIGIKILQASFRKKYPDESYKELWREFALLNGDIFIKACDALKREGVKLPVLAEIFSQYRVLESEYRKQAELEEFRKPAPQVSPEEFEQTSKMLSEVTAKLKSKREAQKAPEGK